MKSILKWYLLLNIIFFGSWPFVRQYLPVTVKEGYLPIVINFATEPVENLLGVKEKLIKVNKYDSRIIPLDDKILASLIDKIKTRKIKAVLLFYNPKNIMHRVSFQQMNRLAGMYKGVDSVSIIPVAVSFDKNDLNRFVDYLPTVNVPLVFLNQANLNDIQKSIITIKIDTDKDPNFFYINTNGLISKEEYTYIMDQKVNRFLNNN